MKVNKKNNSIEKAFEILDRMGKDIIALDNLNKVIITRLNSLETFEREFRHKDIFETLENKPV